MSISASTSKFLCPSTGKCISLCGEHLTYSSPYKKIYSSFSGFTADQSINWTDTYSLLSLYDILDKDNLELWRHFMLVSWILTQMQITTTELELADALLLCFCNRAQRMYGCEFVTPNIHKHGHLKDCVLDYGPIHNFCCFSYERYNGMLENYPSNTSVEVWIDSWRNFSYHQPHYQLNIKRIFTQSLPV